MVGTDSVIVRSPAGKPIDFAGPPGSVTGTVELRNMRAHSVVLRDAGLLDRSGRLWDAQRQHHFSAIMLRAEQDENVPLTMQLDPATPPGKYAAEFRIGGETRPAVISVAETLLLKASPLRFWIANVQDVQRKSIRVTNMGNVPASVVSPGEVELYEDVSEETDLHAAIEALLARNDPTLKDALRALATLLGKARGRPVGKISIRVEESPIVVAPAESRAIELDLTVPRDLSPNRRYRARAPLSTADLDVVVLPSHLAEPKGKREPPAKPPRRRERAAREGHKHVNRGERR